MRKISLILITIFFFVYSAGWSQEAEISAEAGPASGSVVNGYRILSIQKNTSELHLTVYRGDYIKFKLDPSMQNPLLSIPDLAIYRKLPNSPAEAPYFKMKTPGTFDFSLGDTAGKITVIDYRQASYREVSSREAAELIKSDQPIILDVRTPKEYKRGHLPNSVLIPVQELQSRQKELGAHKDQEILIYCATGNRSTVASKILIDNGFKHIVNMRGGISDWSKKNYPVTR